MKETKSIFKFDDNMKILSKEIKNYLKNNRISKTTLKTNHFLDYFASKNNSFNNTPLDLIWSYSYFKEKFLSEITTYKYDTIIPSIIQLLCGNFEGVIKKKKITDLRKPNTKICSFYLFPIKNKNDDNILFSLCLKGKNPSTHIYFLSIAREYDYEEEAKDFLEEINKDNENFPLIDYDKDGLFMVEDILISHSIKDNVTGVIIKYPLNNIELNNNLIFEEKHIRGNVIKIFNDAKDFLGNKLNESIIEQIEDNQYENLIISAIEGGYWDFKLSSQEKKYIKNSDTFLLYGRPGTGKSTVLLIKLFSIYFNHQLKKKQRLLNNKNKNNINNNNNNNNNKINETQNLITENLRVVFTSLSQTFCEKQEMIFEEKMVEKINELEFNHINKNKLISASSFRNLHNYPIFMNFRKILFMIDGSLTFQFFHRHNLKEYEGDNDTQYNYVPEYIYDVNKYIFSGDPKHLNFFYRSPKFESIIRLKEANEGTFIQFYRNFLTKKENPLAKKIINLNLNPLEIYAQLMSVIKGSYSSHLYIDNCISKEDYKSKGKKVVDLPNLDEIYDICLLYEEYKKNKYFDIQDIVNFLIRQVKLELKEVKLIDYLFIDEIQDLTISQIYLLTLVSKYCKSYAGDTCQTISKINRFRFSELGNVFYNFKRVILNYPEIKNAYLSLNYRLNSKILKLSTFMAYLMKELFPNTLDKFQDDFSIKVIDQNPILLNNIDIIINNIIQSNVNNQNTDYSLSLNHCFIYGNKEDENKLHNLYGDRIYKLSIEKSKGLEFEIVIVYNFFSSSKYKKIWDIIFDNIVLKKDDSIINGAKIQLSEILHEENLTYLIETLNLKNIYENLSENGIQQKLLNELNLFIFPKLEYKFDKHEIFEFCSEIKRFYVIITRPRTFLIFYEENNNIRSNNFYKFMIDNSLIDKENESNNQNTVMASINSYLAELKINEQTPTHLRILGNVAFNHQNYSRAVFLYKNSGDYLLASIAEIFYNMNILLGSLDNNFEDKYIEEISNKIIFSIKEISSHDLENEIPNDNNRINITKILKQFKQFKGKIFIILGKYEEAALVFKENNMINQLGMLYYKYIKNYEEAFNCFDSIANYRYALLVLKDLKNSIKIFSYANKIADHLSLIEYNDVYIEFINQLFEEFSIWRKIEINSKIDLENTKLKTLFDEKNVSTNNDFINYFFIEYLNNINFLAKKEENSKENKISNDNNSFELIEQTKTKNKINNFDKNEFKNLQIELNLNYNTNQFIYAYRFKTPKNIYIELLKLFPEFL